LILADLDEGAGISSRRKHARKYRGLAYARVDSGHASGHTTTTGTEPSLQVR
jgi:hypothetical protein